MRKVFSIATALLLAISGTAHAVTISFSDSVPLTTTNWSDSVDVQQFDPSLGTLTGILFELSGHVEGSAAYENRDNAPATVTLNLQAQIVLQRPDLSTLVVVLPVVSRTESALAFDGTTDFGGTSGSTFPGLISDKSDSKSSPPPVSDLALFTGLGKITLPVIATGPSNGSGAGNLALLFDTHAAADVKVTYTYDLTTTTIPEPGTVLLLGSGIIGVWLARFRKQSR